MRVLSPAVLLLIVLGVACSEQGSPGRSSTAPSPVNASSSSAGPASREVGAVASAAASNALQLSAIIQFGKPDVGSNFGPPAPPHDQSAHAKDDMVPRTVVIDKGGKVTINTFGVHQVAIYDDGTEPEDIDTTDLVLTPTNCPKPMGTTPLLINDDTNRIKLYSQPCGGAPRQVVHEFKTPGKYLVICAFLPHFQVQMYGWVIVRDR
jgi:plastocyanin